MKLGAVLILMAGLSLAGFGCGRFMKPKSGDPSSPGGGQSAQSPFRFVSASEDPALPGASDGGRSSKRMDEVLIQGDEFVFKNAIRIPKNPPIFLVWSENALGTPIRDAHFTHRIQDPANRHLGSPERMPVSFDSENRRWFLSLSTIAEKAQGSIDPSDVHLFTLDLFLADGTRRELHLYLKLAGPVLPVSLKELPPQPQDVSSARSSVVFRYEVANPYRRGLALWVRPQGKLIWTGSLFRNRWQEYPNRAPVGPFWDRFSAPVEVLLSKVAVIRARGASELYDVPASDGWVRIPLGPQEKIEVNWLARASATSPICTVPAPAARVIGWVRRTMMHCGRGECFGGDDVSESVRVVQEWRWAGSRIHGDGSIQMRVTDDWVGKGELELEVEASAQKSLGSVFDMDVFKGLIERRSGDFVESRDLFPCSGVF